MSILPSLLCLTDRLLDRPIFALGSVTQSMTSRIWSVLMTGLNAVERQRVQPAAQALRAWDEGLAKAQAAE